MPDLVERNKVLETVFNVMSDDKVIHKHRALNRNIKQLPSADTEQNASWECIGCTPLNSKQYYKCTNCSKIIAISSKKEFEENVYCRKCGCKMDEVGK